jgi:hypothetical protein
MTYLIKSKSLHVLTAAKEKMSGDLIV